MLIASNLSITEVKQPNIHLFLKCSTHLLLPQFIEKLMGEGLGCVESLLWWIDHDLGEKVEE